jgi:hypothetical protein
MSGAMQFPNVPSGGWGRKATETERREGRKGCSGPEFNNTGENHHPGPGDLRASEGAQAPRGGSWLSATYDVGHCSPAGSEDGHCPHGVTFQAKVTPL